MGISNNKSEEFNNIEGLIEYSKKLALESPDAPEWEDLILLSDHLNKLLKVRDEELEARRQRQAEVDAKRLLLDKELEKLRNLPERMLQFWEITDCRQWQTDQVPESNLEEVLATTRTLMKTLYGYEKTEKQKASTLQERQKLRQTRDQLENQFMICMECLNKIFREVPDKDELVFIKNKGLAEVEKSEPVVGEGQLIKEEGVDATDIPEALQLEEALIEIAEIIPAGGDVSESAEIRKGNDVANEVPYYEKVDEISETNLVDDESIEPMDGWLIAVHTLRGGLGCTSIAVNLAIGLLKLWGYTTLLMDNDFVSGQVALMLNASASRTWADFVVNNDSEFEIDALAASISFHDSGLHFLAAPANSAEQENVDPLTVKLAFQALRKKYAYLVADLAHDLSDVTMEVLKAADQVLLLLSPEIVSVRLAALALRGYSEHHIHSNRVQLILVHNSAQSQLKENEIEKALNHPISHIIPYAPKESNRAIASGVPILIQDHKSQISSTIEDLAYLTSKPIHREISPSNPSNTWKRVLSRQGSSTDKNQRVKLQLPFLGNLKV